MEFKTQGLSQEQWAEVVANLTDEQVQAIASEYIRPAYSSPVRHNDQVLGEDGFAYTIPQTIDFRNFNEVQTACWKLAQLNPQINSHIRDVMGYLTGNGFAIESSYEEIQILMDLIVDDVRNEFMTNVSRYAASSEINGELFLALTIHSDGFVEIDYVPPSSINGVGIGNFGIYFHPTKPTLPILYNVSIKTPEGDRCVLVPSNYVAHYPSFIKETLAANNLPLNTKVYGRSFDKAFEKLGGYTTFIVSWQRGFMAERNISHISTTLEWINHYTNLKSWEIDHKKSSGSYLWVITMEDTKALRQWLTMTDEDKAKCGLAAKKTPGGTLLLPPGFKLSCENPKLASISEQDNDILHMVTAGLNKPEDIVTGQTKGSTFAGVKASRGPYADRVRDELVYWERFLRYQLWRTIIHVHSIMVPSFKTEIKVKKTVDFKNQKPVQKTFKVPAYKLIDFTFPTSETSDIEGRAKALMGVNHQAVSESLGIPRSEIARRLGFSAYNKLRCQYEDEAEYYPELPIDAQLLAGASQKQVGNVSLKNNQAPAPNKTDSASDEQK